MQTTPDRTTERVVGTLYILQTSKGYPLCCNTKVTPRKALNYGFEHLCQARTHHCSPTLHNGFLRRRRPRALNLPDPPPCGPRSDTPNLVRK